MWKRFPEVISFDNTYNTNRFKLPLFQATGQTCLKSVYNAAFGLIDNERREGFQFLAEGIRQLVERHGIQLPNVVITDFDQQMKAALEDQFPDAQQQLCILYINSNVLLNAKRKWKHAKEDSDGGSNTEQSQATLNSRDKEAVLAAGRQDEPLSRSNVSTTVPHNYRGVLEMWKLVVFAETKEDYEKCFIKKHRNFGIRVTSGTEASNNNVKSYLLNGMNHLFGLIEAIEGMLGLALGQNQSETAARTVPYPGNWGSLAAIRSTANWKQDRNEPSWTTEEYGTACPYEYGG
ncbi:MULE transposase domain-containing protein [Hirsutella rhossiliensis]|uniref:MULE transposase domain-containing protein n=1 Tax=Hirsutella rhossiliensis TaxID=111463 RepID=A0A9P8MU76_9HYPO|nr:MULE transposase domain-containing protein [Hirsutella rhossiliensis]KAH0961320.1 MULE transposase domain-containing protein [Hirsutella rhossiliensis]